MRLVLTAEQARTLTRTSLARTACLLRPRLPDAFFRRLVPVHLREEHPLARHFGAPLVHLLIDAAPREGALEVRVLGAVGDRSLRGIDFQEDLKPADPLDAEALAALATRLERAFALVPPGEHERYPSVWEAAVTALLGGRVIASRGPARAVIERRNAFARAFGTLAQHGSQVFAALPDPAGLRERRVYQLTAIGIPHATARRCLAVARNIAHGKLDLAELFGKPRSAVLDALGSIDGLSRSGRDFVARYGVGTE